MAFVGSAFFIDIAPTIWAYFVLLNWSNALFFTHCDIETAAFFIKDGVAIGAYAKDKINAWITEFKENSISEEEMQKKIALIGEPIIQRRLEQIAKRHGINSIAENIRRDERQSIIDFLKAQQAALQHQIQLLEAEQR